MASIFETQRKLKQDLGLHKIGANLNKNYKPHGTKSYVHLMNRFGFQPTKPGPYFFASQSQSHGLNNCDLATKGRVRMAKLISGDPSSPDDTHIIGEVTAEDQQNDSEYLCEVEIGTPPQKVLLDFDTGSSDLWVFSPKLSRRTEGTHNIFNPAASSTWKPLNSETWLIRYGDGSTASGTVGTDILNLGGIKVEDQAIELASHLSSQFRDGTGDGLLGLAFPKINTVKAFGRPKPAQTPVANMITDSDIPENAALFTSAFYSERDDAKRSFYTFGWIDQDLVQASNQDIHWTPVDSSQGFWMFPSTSASVNGKSINLSGNAAIADTGTTLALISDTACEALYGQIEGAKYNAQVQGYTIPKSTKAADLPDFSVAVGDKQFIIQKEDLLFVPADDDSWYGGVQSRGDNPFDILGDTFLKSIYAIWDQGNERFGCVPKIEKVQNVS